MEVQQTLTKTKELVSSAKEKLRSGLLGVAGSVGEGVSAVGNAISSRFNALEYKQREKIIIGSGVALISGLLLVGGILIAKSPGGFSCKVDAAIWPLPPDWEGMEGSHSALIVFDGNPRDDLIITDKGYVVCLDGTEHRGFEDAAPPIPTSLHKRDILASDPDRSPLVSARCVCNQSSENQ